MPDVRGYLLDSAKVLLANLAAIGVAEGGITFLGLGAEVPGSEDGFELTDAQFGSGDFAEEAGNGGGRESLIEGLADHGEGGFVLNGDGGLLKHGWVTFGWGWGPRILRRIGKAKAVPFQNSS